MAKLFIGVFRLARATTCVTVCLWRAISPENFYLRSVTTSLRVGVWRMKGEEGKWYIFHAMASMRYLLNGPVLNNDSAGRGPPDLKFRFLRTIYHGSFVSQKRWGHASVIPESSRIFSTSLVARYNASSLAKSSHDGLVVHGFGKRPLFTSSCIKSYTKA